MRRLLTIPAMVVAIGSPLLIDGVGGWLMAVGMLFLLISLWLPSIQDQHRLK
jgi:hypothetical protein